jgi:hypothetical protein
VKRGSAVAATTLLALVAHGSVLAQTSGATTKPNLNWVFDLAVVTGLAFLGFIGFLLVYYAFAVVARSRRFAVPTAVTQGGVRVPVGVAAPAAVVPAAAALPAAAAPAAPAPAESAPAPAAGTPTAAAPAPAAAPDTGGLPHIDPNNLPDGIDVVTRGRLKKLAVLQERGQAPPPELVEALSSVLAQMGGAPAAAPVAEPAPAPAAAAPAPAPAEAPVAEPPGPAEPAAPAPAAEPAPAPAPEPPPVAAPAAAASTSGVPHIDLNNLPAGIDAVTRGRLKKLAVLQERGQEPPADLVEALRPVLDQMG